MITAGSHKKIDQHDNFTGTVSCHYCDRVRDRKIQTALRTNQIARLVTIPSWDKMIIINNYSPKWR